MQNLRYFFPLLVYALLSESVNAAAPWDLVNSDSSCFNYKVAGCCGQYCETARIKHRIPVLFIEVVKAPGDTVMGGAGSVMTGTRSSDGNDNTFEVRVWNTAVLSYLALKLTTTCFTCPLRIAEVAGRVQNGEEESKSCGTCGVSDDALAMTLNIDNAMPIELVYDSTLDIVNWRTGCRDTAALKAMGPSIVAKCVAEGIGSAAQDLGLKSPLSQLGGSSGEDTCVGSWGMLYPRQMRTHSTELVAAAFTAYRALHIAGETLGTTNFDVSDRGVLQPALPDKGKCFHPGANTFLVERTRTSTDGRYGFFWWVDVSCCRPWTDIVTCISDIATEATEAVTSGFASTAEQLGKNLGSSCGLGGGIPK